MSKSWTACGYISEDEINASNKYAIIPYSVENVGTMVEKFCGEDACTNFEDEGANGPEPFFPATTKVMMITRKCLAGLIRLFVLELLYIYLKFCILLF